MFSKSIKSFQKEIKSLQETGNTHLEQGDYKKALSSFLQIEMKLNNKEVLKTLTDETGTINAFDILKTMNRCNLATCYFYLGHYDKAKTNLTEVINTSFMTDESWYLLAYANHRLGDHLTAKKILDRKQINEATNKLQKNIASLYLKIAAAIPPAFTASVAKHYYQIAEKNYYHDFYYHFYLATNAIVNDNYKEAYYNYKACTDLLLNTKIQKNDENKSFLIQSLCAVVELADKYDFISDPQENIYFLELAASYGSAEALHDLGYKYEHGEDVPCDYNLAFAYYTKAAALGYNSSLTNLYIVSSHLNKNVDAIVAKLEQIKSDSYTYAFLGNHYFLQFLNSLPEQKLTNEAKPAYYSNNPLAVKAFSYNKKAATMSSPNPLALYNYACLLITGVGTEPNTDLAEKYFLEAAKQGITRAYNDIAGISQDKLTMAKNTHIKQKVEMTISYTPNVRPTDSLLQATDSQEKIKTIQELKGELEKQSFKLNLSIIESAEQYQHTCVNNIKDLLDINVEALSARNFATLIHRLGKLTERSLDQHNFHQSQLPAITSLFKEALKKREQYNLHEAVNLIEGLSKLNLAADLEVYYKLLGVCYAKVTSNMNQLSLRELVTCVFATTRFDRTLPLLKKKLPNIINYVIENASKLDERSFTNFLFSLALLDNSEVFCVDGKMFHSLFEMMLKLQKPKTYLVPDEKTQTTESYFVNDSQASISLNQKFMLLFYFYNKFKSSLPISYQDIIVSLQNQITELSGETQPSKLQLEVTEFVEQYFPDSVIEKYINKLPVDAFFMINQEQGFILQVDGPSHFLHGQADTAIHTTKTLFRNQFLNFSCPYPQICVPYFEWQKLHSTAEKANYLRELLAKHNLALPEVKWEKVKNKRNNYDQHRFSLGSNKPTDTSQSNTPFAKSVNRR